MIGQRSNLCQVVEDPLLSTTRSLAWVAAACVHKDIQVCIIRAGAVVMLVPHSLLVGAAPLSSGTSPVVDMIGALIYEFVSLQTTASKVERISLCGTEQSVLPAAPSPPGTCRQPWLPSTIHRTSHARLFTCAHTGSHGGEDASQCHRPRRPQPSMAPLTSALMGGGPSLPRRKGTSAAPTKASLPRCQGAFLIP